MNVRHNGHLIVGLTGFVVGSEQSAISNADAKDFEKGQRWRRNIGFGYTAMCQVALHLIVTYKFVTIMIITLSYNAYSCSSLDCTYGMNACVSFFESHAEGLSRASVWNQASTYRYTCYEAAFGSSSLIVVIFHKLLGRIATLFDPIPHGDRVHAAQS